MGRVQVKDKLEAIRLIMDGEKVYTGTEGDLIWDSKDTLAMIFHKESKYWIEQKDWRDDVIRFSNAKWLRCKETRIQKSAQARNVENKDRCINIYGWWHSYDEMISRFEISEE